MVADLCSMLFILACSQHPVAHTASFDLSANLSTNAYFPS